MQQHFDIRITGEADDAAELARSVVAKVVLAGARIHHASLDGREVRVVVDRIEIKSDDPDELVADAMNTHKG